jgi:CHAD domain-containing protein
VKSAPETLTLPAPRGLRLVALELLGAAAQAADRLSHARDDEALHDFRVSVRRLRSWLRAFKDDLHGTVRRRDRRALRSLVTATSSGRDAEVQLAWLDRIAKGKHAKRKRGATWLSEYVRERQALAGDAFDESCIREFENLREQLVERFSKALDDSDDDQLTLAAAIAVQLPAHVDTLVAALHAVHGFDDETPAHEARIAAKRLRYLVEPTAARIKLAATMVERLKTLQDDLGELHDVHVLGHTLREAIAASPLAEIEDVVTVVAWLERDTKAIFRRVERGWLERATTVRKLTRDATTIAKRLNALEE